MDAEKIITALIEQWCDQYGQEIISLKISKKEEKLNMDIRQINRHSEVVV